MVTLFDGIFTRGIILTISLTTSTSFTLCAKYSFHSGLDSYEAVKKTFLAAKRDLGEILSSCEMIDRLSLRCSVDNFNLT